VREIAKQYGLKPGAIQKHKVNIGARIKKYTIEQNEKPVDYLSELEELRKRALKLMDEAGEDKRLVLLAMREAREFMVLLGKWTGQYTDSPGVQVNIQQNVIDAMPTVRRVLEEGYPEAWAEVIAALRG
jgi:hypothetical protein